MSSSAGASARTGSTGKAATRACGRNFRPARSRPGSARVDAARLSVRHVPGRDPMTRPHAAAGDRSAHRFPDPVGPRLRPAADGGLLAGRGRPRRRASPDRARLHQHMGRAAARVQRPPGPAVRLRRVSGGDLRVVRRAAAVARLELPAVLSVLFWPLAQLPYFVALAAWTFGLFAIFAAMTLSRVERSARPLLLLLLLLAPATLINAVGGQNGFLTACLLVGGILLLDRRPVLAGILFGLLTYQAPSRPGRAVRSAGAGRLADHCGGDRDGDPADGSLGRAVRTGCVARLLPGHRGSAGSRARAVQRFRPPDGDVRDGGRRAHVRCFVADGDHGADRGRGSGHRARRMGDPADVSILRGAPSCW